MATTSSASLQSTTAQGSAVPELEDDIKSFVELAKMVEEAPELKLQQSVLVCLISLSLFG